MFSYIKGKVISVEENTAVIECGGIGYEILVSTSTAAKLSEKQEALLNIHMQVKEDAFTLYGFYTREEKDMFKNLITVSGVGCKVGLAILSGVNPGDLALCIANEDAAVLSRIKGIGKKTAERIILELKGKVAALIKSEAILPGKAVSLSGSAEEAFSALMALGLRRSECVSAVQAAIEGGASKTEEIIGYALKNMDR